MERLAETIADGENQKESCCTFLRKKIRENTKKTGVKLRELFVTTMVLLAVMVGGTVGTFVAIALLIKAVKELVTNIWKGARSLNAADIRVAIRRDPKREKQMGRHTETLKSDAAP